MSLRDRLVANAGTGTFGMARAYSRSADSLAHEELKARIHRTLLDKVDLQRMEAMSQQQIRDELKSLVEELLASENVVLNDIERKTLVRDIQYEMLGLGPLELLMSDPSVSDILVNSCKQVYVARFGKLEP